MQAVVNIDTLYSNLGISDKISREAFEQYCRASEDLAPGRTVYTIAYNMNCFECILGGGTKESSEDLCPPCKASRELVVRSGIIEACTVNAFGCQIDVNFTDGADKLHNTIWSQTFDLKDLNCWFFFDRSVAECKLFEVKEGTCANSKPWWLM